MRGPKHPTSPTEKRHARLSRTTRFPDCRQRCQGFTYRQIGERMHCAHSTAARDTNAGWPWKRKPTPSRTSKPSRSSTWPCTRTASTISTPTSPTPKPPAPNTSNNPFPRPPPLGEACPAPDAGVPRRGGGGPQPQPRKPLHPRPSRSNHHPNPHTNRPNLHRTVQHRTNPNTSHPSDRPCRPHRDQNETNPALSSDPSHNSPSPTPCRLQTTAENSRPTTPSSADSSATGIGPDPPRLPSTHGTHDQAQSATRH